MKRIQHWTRGAGLGLGDRARSGDGAGRAARSGDGAEARRRWAGIAVAAGVALAVTGCQTIPSHAVADHDAQVAYHADAVQQLLAGDLVASLAATPSFDAVGYSHAIASTGEKLHVQIESHVDGGTEISRESRDKAGYTIDLVHHASSSVTYYLFGDNFVQAKAVPTPWMAVPEGDNARGSDPKRVCDMRSVYYMCSILDAWQATRTANPSIPTLVDRGADGTVHMSTAAAFDELERAGVFGMPEALRSKFSEDDLRTLIGVQVWLDSSGNVTKLEANGKIGSDVTVELQSGFELRPPGSATVPDINPATLDPKVITYLTTKQQADEMWARIIDAYGAAG